MRYFPEFTKEEIELVPIHLKLNSIMQRILYIVEVKKVPFSDENDYYEE